jgi:hypothetical protein
MKDCLYILLFILIFIIPSFNQTIEDEDKEREDTIYLKSNINEIFASTELTQYFINSLENPIELIISFPIKEEINLNKFIVQIGEKIVTSKVMKKEIAEEKYDDSISSGNTGFLGEYDNEMKSYSINLGNINPKEKVILKAFFIQNIGTQDMSYEFIIMEKYPTFHYKELNKEGARNKIIKANFIIEAQSKITRLIAPFFDEMAQNKSTYEVTFSNDYKKAEIIYVKNPDDQKNKDIIDEIYGEEYGYPGKVNEPTFLTSFSILFRTENINKPILYYQFNPELNETSYSINYVYSSEELKEIPIPEKPDQDNKISYYSKYENSLINESPGLFVFLIDQSGSMTGKPIELLKQGLLLLIQSLPPNSYFQLIGFGTNFKKYNEEAVEYNEENVEYILNIINNLDADLGGTNINSPLESIYSDTSYSKINLSKHIFLLTDGQVNDREGCVNLITANSNKFRMHAFGIGNAFDKYFIERSGKLGKGSSFFIEDVEEISSTIISALNKCIRPYLIDIHFNFQNYENNIKNNIISCEPNNISNQDEIISFSFILNEENNINIDKLKDPILIEISGKNPYNIIKENISIDQSKNIIRLSNGDELSKMIIGKALKENKELIDDKEKEIEFSTKYQILSKNTALFAEIINDNNDNNQNELISVNLNDYIKEGSPFIPWTNWNQPGAWGGAGGWGNGNAGGGWGNSGSAWGNGNAGGSWGGAGGFDNGNMPSYDFENDNNNIDEEIKDKFENDKSKNYVTKLIISQNIIEGYWDENEETKELMNIFQQAKIDQIIEKIKSLNKGEENENKIKYTILVIYYLNTEYSDKIDEYILIINKGKKYLLNQGIKYEDIIDGL